MNHNNDIKGGATHAGVDGLAVAASSIASA